MQDLINFYKFPVQSQNIYDPQLFEDYTVGQIPTKSTVSETDIPEYPRDVLHCPDNM